MHYRYADSQKYTNLGRFLYNNYRQSLDIIDENEGLLKALEIERKWTGDVYQTWLKEELVYLNAIGQEPAEEKLTLLYLEAYDAWKKAE